MIKNLIKNAIHGFTMALADSVPGVSGGTIAFLLGFYEKFIGSINSLFKGTKEERIAALKYLINLVVGWIIGMGIAVTVLASVFEKQIYGVSSLFLGFIISAIPVMIYEERETLRKGYNFYWAIIGAALVVGISIWGKYSNVDIGGMGVGAYFYSFVAGFVAISAMVLPGISGSTILLTFGVYIPVIQALKNALHLDFAGLPLIISIAAGAIVGIFVSVRLIKKALDKKRCQTLYTVIGMMIGSLYAIVQGPTTLDNPQAPMNFSTFKVVPFIIGIVIVAGLQIFQNLSKRAKNNK